jgi:hypothetical protein
MRCPEYLIIYILLLIALHFIYLFYMLSFTLNTLNMLNTIHTIQTFENNTIHYKENIVIIDIDMVFNIPFNTTI